jgi:hypothetical protein
MNHKFYYYEYSDDGGLTWNFGDYRKHLMTIIDVARDNPYKIRIKNENDEVVGEDLIVTTENHLDTFVKIMNKL